MKWPEKKEKKLRFEFLHYYFKNFKIVLNKHKNKQYTKYKKLFLNLYNVPFGSIWIIR